MQHLIVSVGILALAVGVAAMMAIRRLDRRFSLLFLKYYWRYLVVLNISVLLNLALHYLLTNVLTFLDTHHKVLLVIIVNIAGFYLFILLTVFFLHLTRSLVGKPVARLVKNLAFFIIIAASLAYGYATAQYASSSKIAIFMAVHRVSIVIPTLVSLAASILLFSEAVILHEKSRVRILRLFSAVYAVFFFIQFIQSFLSTQVWIALSTLNLLILNILPLLFLTRLVRDQESKGLLKQEIEAKIEHLYNAHGLTKREKDIAALLMAGKSNEEIEAELYISIFTVKKHVSNIFGKLDIRSRSQFSHMVMRAALDDEFDGSIKRNRK